MPQQEKGDPESIRFTGDKPRDIWISERDGNTAGAIFCRDLIPNRITEIILNTFQDSF